MIIQKISRRLCNFYLILVKKVNAGFQITIFNLVRLIIFTTSFAQNEMVACYEYSQWTTKENYPT